jgi:multidrug efflux pump
MNISKFFIDRPIFAGALSTLVLVARLISLFLLPISEYSEVIPPSVIVHAQYPGLEEAVVQGD